MSSHVFIIIIIQYILLICLYLIYMVENQNIQLFQKSKLFNSLFAGLIGSMMIYMDMFNDFESVFPMYTLTLRLLMISLIILFPKGSNNIIILTLMVLTRLFAYDDFTRNLKIYLLIGLIVLITRLIDLLKISKYVKFYYIVCILGFSSMIYLGYMQFSLQSIFYYNMFVFSIIFITFIIYKDINKRYKKPQTVMLNQNDIEYQLEKLINSHMAFHVLLIEINQLNRLKTIMKLGNYNNLISEISNLIKKRTNGLGLVGTLRTDQYCIIIKQDELIDLNQFGNLIKCEVVRIFNLYNVSNKCNVGYKLMDDSDFVYYHRPQYSLTNI